MVVGFLCFAFVGCLWVVRGFFCFCFVCVCGFFGFVLFFLNLPLSLLENLQGQGIRLFL